MNIVYQMWQDESTFTYTFAGFDFQTPETDMDKIGKLLVEKYKTVWDMNFYVDATLPMIHLYEIKPNIQGKTVAKITHHMVAWLDVKYLEMK